jgi:WD40 repeat protein
VWSSSGGAPLVLKGHERAGAYRRLAFRPHSDLLVTKSDRDDPLRIWSIPQGELVRKMDFDAFTGFALRKDRLFTWTGTPGHDTWFRSWPFLEGPAGDLGRIRITDVTDFDIDGTGKWLALGRGRQVLIRPLERLRTGEERLVGTHPAKVTGIAFGPDRRLLSRDEKGEIRFWSLDSGDAQPVRVVRVPADMGGAWFDRTGSSAIAAFQKERLVRLWDMTGPSESEPQVLRRGDAPRVELADTTADGQWLAVANESSVSLWPLTRRSPRILAGHAERIWQLRFAPDGSWIASGSWDGTAKIWPLDQRAGRASWTALQKGGMVYGLAVDPSGSRVLTSDITHDGRILVRKPFQETPPSRLEPGVFAPVGAAFDRQGRRAAVGAAYSPSLDGSVIRVWNVETGRLLNTLDLLEGKRPSQAPGYAGGVQDLEFAPDGRLYSAGSGGVRRWDVERGTSESVLQGPWMGMDLGDDGRHLLTTTRTANALSEVPSAVAFHDLGDRSSRSLASHGEQVLAVALDATAKVAVTGSNDGIVRAGSVTGEEPHLLYGHKGPVYAVAVSPDGRWIASGAQDGTVRLWPMPDFSKPPIHTLPYQELLTKLKTLTNLHVVEDKNFPTGYKLDVGPFLGWDTAPTW